jgi:hypothetical protein
MTDQTLRTGEPTPDIEMPADRLFLRREHLLEEFDRPETASRGSRRRVRPLLAVAFAAAALGLIGLTALNPFSSGNGRDPLLEQAAAALGDPATIWHYRVSDREGRSLGGADPAPPVMTSVWASGTQRASVARSVGKDPEWADIIAQYFDNKVYTVYRGDYDHPRAVTVSYEVDDEGSESFFKKSLRSQDPTRTLDTILDQDREDGLATEVKSKRSVTIAGREATEVLIHGSNEANGDREVIRLYLDKRSTLPIKLIEQEFYEGNESSIPNNARISRFSGFTAIPRNARTEQVFQIPVKPRPISCEPAEPDNANRKQCTVKTMSLAELTPRIDQSGQRR